MFGFNSLNPQQFILAIDSIGFLPSKFVVKQRKVSLPGVLFSNDKNKAKKAPLNFILNKSFLFLKYHSLNPYRF